MTADRCACKHPKPVEVTDETDSGAGWTLNSVWHYCDRCGGTIDG